MTSVSTIAVGANMAAAGGAKARHGMTEEIARLSTGVRECMEVMQVVLLKRSK